MINTIKKNDIEKFRLTLTAICGENDLIDIMKKISNEVELSSLPKIIDNKRKVVLSLSSKDKKKLDDDFSMFTLFLDKQKIEYELKDVD